jgi:1-deoxy-D-xylulose-5-phosphate synthase
VVTCQEGDPEFEVESSVAPAVVPPARLAQTRFGPPETVYGRFSRELPNRVHANKLLWLDESAADAPKVMEQHLRMFRALEQGRSGRPVLVVPSALLPTLYAELRGWCLDVTRESPVLIVHGSGIPAQRERGPGGLTDGHLLLSIPELTLAKPADETEAGVLFDEAMAQRGPAALVFTQAPAVGLRQASSPVPGKGRKLRDGKELAIMALGSTVFPSLLAAESLQAVGLQVAVYDLRYRRPIDRALMAEAARYPLMVTVEEGPESGSFASHLLSAEHSARLIRLTVEVAELKQRLLDEPHALALESFGMHAEGIARAVKSALQLGPTF